MRATRAAAAAALLLACSGDDATGPGGAVATLAIQPGQVHTLTAFGQTVQLHAVAHNPFGHPISDPDIEWTSRDPAAATVDNGLVTAQGDGSTFIVALSGDAADSVQVVVERPVGVPTIAIVSGGGQPGRAGRDLAQPFVVRVTNARGEPVPDYPVLWNVTSGDGRIDGRRLNQCEVPPPYSTTTDAEGLAQVVFTPTWFGPSTVTAHVAVRPEDPVSFSADATDPGATLTIVAGTPQEATAGDFDPLASLLVRVTDGQGNPVAETPVTWRFASGSGLIRYPDCEFLSIVGQTITRTYQEGEVIGHQGGDYDGYGVSQAWAIPMQLGPSTVVASLWAPAGSAGTALAAFEIEATTLLLQIFPDFSGSGAGTQFVGPDPVTRTLRALGSFTVPVGTPVEWLSDMPEARVMSTATPPGGAAFDSGSMSPGDRFSFTPGVAGTWEFLDQVSGAMATLTAE